jgi:hypothetical protein
MTNNISLEVFNTIANALKELTPEDQKRTLLSIVTFLNIELFSTENSVIVGSVSTKNNDSWEPNNKGIAFSENRSLTAKEFLRDKSPQTDIERIACLAYYLTHYRDSSQFKTVDLSTLNTEAAQPKFSNAARAVDNATKAGLLVQGTQGRKQVSAAGEGFVQALPDRELAKNALTNLRIKRKSKKTSTTKRIVKSES